MQTGLNPFSFLVLSIGGWINQRQEQVIEYLIEENHVLREQLGNHRMRFSDDQRCRLAAKVFEQHGLLFWTATDLEMKLVAFQDFYNRYRTHSALQGQTPIRHPESKRAELKRYRWQTHCRGLYQTRIAV